MDLLRDTLFATVSNNVEIDNSLHKVGYCVSTHVELNRLSALAAPPLPARLPSAYSDGLDF